MVSDRDRQEFEEHFPPKAFMEWNPTEQRYEAAGLLGKYTVALADQQNARLEGYLAGKKEVRSHG